MALVILSEDIAKPIEEAAVIVSLSLLTLILIYHIFSTRKSHQIDPSHGKAPYFCLLLFMFAFELDILSLFAMYTPIHSLCVLTKYLAIPPYAIFKWILYLILLYRLHRIFGHKYSKKLLIVWGAILTVWSMLNVVISMALIESIYDANYYPVCNLEDTTFISLTSIAFLDILAVTVNAYLFIKPIIELRKRNINQQKSEGLMKVAVKQCVLAMCAVCSSLFVALGIALVEMGKMWIAIDVVVSICSVILMFSWNSGIAEVACCCCLKKYDDNVIKMGIVMSSNNPPAAVDQDNDDNDDIQILAAK